MIILVIAGDSGVQSVLASFRQPALFCPCGREFPSIAGLCRACYRSAAHSREHFSDFAKPSWIGIAAGAGPADRPADSMCIIVSPASTTPTG